MGLENEIGSLEVGKRADLVAWTGKPFDATSRIVTVLVDGNIIMENRHLLTGNVEALISDANSAVKGLLNRREPFVPEEVSTDDIEV